MYYNPAPSWLFTCFPFPKGLHKYCICFLGEFIRKADIREKIYIFFLGSWKKTSVNTFSPIVQRNFNQLLCKPLKNKKTIILILNLILICAWGLNRDAFHAQLNHYMIVTKLCIDVHFGNRVIYWSAFDYHQGNLWMTSNQDQSLPWRRLRRGCTCCTSCISVIPKTKGEGRVWIEFESFNSYLPLTV